MQTNKVITICFMLLMGLISCNDMNSIQQKYLDLDVKIYLGKTDSLTTFPGKERIKLCWYINADPRIQETVIYWNQRKDSVIKPFIRTKPGIQKDSLSINNLSGTYIFELFNRNDFGDKSLVSSTSGTAYGDDYVNSLNNRSVSSIAVTNYSSVTKSGTVTINWGTANPLCLFTNLLYKKHTTGEQMNIIVTSDDMTTILDDVGNKLGDPNDMINISSMFIPVEGAIDTFPAPVSKAQIALYTANGSRLEYSAAGVLTSTNPYTAQVKTITRVTDDVVYCDRVAAYGIIANTLLRLMINPDNTVSISGYLSGATNIILNTDETSTFDPLTKTFVLKYKQLIASGGTYRIINEILTLQ